MLVSRHGLEGWLLNRANLLRLEAARVKATSRRWINRARHLAGKWNSSAQPLLFRIGQGDGRKQRLRVGMLRRLKQLPPVGDLYHLAQVHHEHSMTDVPHQREIVRDEEVRETQLVLQVGEKIEDLCPDRDIERRDGFVQDQQRGSGRERPGYADSLALAAAELVRITGRMLRRETDQLEFLDVAPRFAAAAEREGLRLVVLPFFEAGLDVYGSGLVTSEALLEDRRDVALRLVRSIRDSLDTTRETPLAGLDALRRRLPGVSAQRAEAGWEASSRLIFLPDAGLGTMTHEKWERTVVHYAEVYGADPLPAEDVFTTALLEHAGIAE